MHLHILGICGTFMGSLALLARELGYRVTGSDANVYPPMNTQLEAAGIALLNGYSAQNLFPEPDLVIVGNALSRGNPEVEALLARKLPYVSGPQWLREHVLGRRNVLAVAGTHGKTTTASMLAWILECGGLQPGFLIGGVPRNFGLSARLGVHDAPFVVEADEYDTAFFDKRSKFVHYRPDIAVLNNLEFDHADIFDDLAAIERQFHHLVRIVPSNGRLLVAASEPALTRVLDKGCWTPVETFGEQGDWQLTLERDDASCFQVTFDDRQVTVAWSMSGLHNAKNGLAAIAAAHACGVSMETAAEALSRFEAPKRRQELRGEIAGIQVIDDFAHHPTAIATTLAGLRAAMVAAQGRPAGRLRAIIEPRSNTMKLGTMKARLPASVVAADAVYWYQPPGLGWSVNDVAAQCPVPAQGFDDLDTLVKTLVDEAQPGDRLVVMSNGGFGGLHDKLLAALRERHVDRVGA